MITMSSFFSGFVGIVIFCIYYGVVLLDYEGVVKKHCRCKRDCLIVFMPMGFIYLNVRNTINSFGDV